VSARLIAAEIFALNVLRNGTPSSIDGRRESDFTYIGEQRNSANQLDDIKSKPFALTYLFNDKRKKKRKRERKERKSVKRLQWSDRG